MDVDDLMTRIKEAEDKLQYARDLLLEHEDSQVIEDLQVINANKLDYSRSDEALLRIHQEMISNLDDIDKMQFFNRLSRSLIVLQSSSVALPVLAKLAALPTLVKLSKLAVLAKLAALAEFTSRVADGREWDHKDMLKDELELNPDKKPGTTGDEDWYFPIEGNDQYEYSYEIWSNIHYGYIGVAAGFTEDELRVGSLAADKGIYVPADDLSVRIGIELWQEHGSNMTDEDLRQAIVDRTEEYRKVQNNTSIAVIDSEDEGWNGK